MTRNNSGDDRRWCQAPSAAVRDKWALPLHYCVVVLRPRGRFWAVAGPVSDHGRQRPLTTHTHRGDNCRLLCPMANFAVRGRGSYYDRQGRHRCHFGGWCCVNHGPSTVGASLDFRKNTNKRPPNRGRNQKQNKNNSPLFSLFSEYEDFLTIILF